MAFGEKTMRGDEKQGHVGEGRNVGSEAKPACLEMKKETGHVANLCPAHCGGVSK